MKRITRDQRLTAEETNKYDRQQIKQDIPNLIAQNNSRKPMNEILGTIQSHELDIKNFELPGVKLKSKCPKCGHENTNDLTDTGDYPIVNGPWDIYILCDKCDYEWNVPVLITLSIKTL